MSRIRTVKDLAEAGISANDIAKYFGVTKDALMAEHSETINTAAINRTVEVANHLYMMAMDGNVQSAIYWLKCLGKWDELPKAKEELSIDDSFEAITVEIIPNKV
jgi:hypothetical protein